MAPGRVAAISPLLRRVVGAHCFPARLGVARAELALGCGQVRAHRTVPVAKGTKLIEFHFKLRDESRKTVHVAPGTDVLTAAHENGIDLEGACENSLACSTCHVILAEDIFDQLPEPCEEEDDLLDLAPCLTFTSRLGCQVVIDESMRGIEVELPKYSLNFYVDGFVPEPH
eukprot:NODE_19326_length_848_cov_6.852982.p1 GENE.NODE_19326_length_848_cov_6.852982~~NODE_19326_length_848_cov_6.852982.p1  ORF type:complete len:171 (+),score=50.62 NODE_19326_length_848_cov_6.852982:115-627(+)